MIKAKEYQEELNRWGISYEVSDWRIKLYGGNNGAREHYESVLRDNPELEALLILLASNEDALLKEQIEERAAIRQADNLPGDLLLAVKAQMPEKNSDEAER